MYTVLTLNKIAPVGLHRLDPNLFVYTDKTDAPDAVIVRSANMHEFPLQDNLLCVARAGAGVNNIPLDKCSEAGIVVFNTPGANANAVKELVLCSLFLASRNVIAGHNWIQTLAGKGSEVGPLVEKGKSQFVGPELEGKTLGVVGLGAIGAMVANAAAALGMRVLGYDPYLSVDGAWGLSTAVRQALDLKRIFTESDYISLHVPLTPETKGSINAETFAMAKPGLRLINMARADLLNTADLLAAIKAGKVACYVTDFPSDALLGVDGVIPIPHLGASTPESEDNCAIMAANQLSDYMRFGNIKNSVNLPDASLEIGADGSRLTVIHKNIPSIVASLCQALADNHINIENMVNKSKKDMAYCIFDLNNEPDENTLRTIANLPNVYRARLIR